MAGRRQQAACQLCQARYHVVRVKNARWPDSASGIRTPGMVKVTSVGSGSDALAALAQARRDIEVVDSRQDRDGQLVTRRALLGRAGQHTAGLTRSAYPRMLLGSGGPALRCLLAPLDITEQ